MNIWSGRGSIFDDSAFTKIHEEWLTRHLKESTGERKRLLEKRISKKTETDEESAETLFLRNVWWPLHGNLDDVHPEMEVRDFNGKDRYLDNAFIRYPLLVDMEVDGYGPHLKEVSRWRFSDERRRDTALNIMGWHVLRFSYDDVNTKPLECQHILNHWLRRATTPITAEEHIVSLGFNHSEFSVRDVARVLGVSDVTARGVLRKMLGEGTLEAVGKGAKRVHFYRLASRRTEK